MGNYLALCCPSLVRLAQRNLNRMEMSSKEPPALNRLLIGGWAMYAVSFILPLRPPGGTMWGYEAFWHFFEEFFDVTLEVDSIWVLAINLSNVIMIASPLILSRVNGRALATLLLIGGISNSRSLCMYDAEILANIFLAYYVWLLSFFATAAALSRTPSLLR